MKYYLIIEKHNISGMFVKEYTTLDELEERMKETVNLGYTIQWGFLPL